MISADRRVGYLSRMASLVYLTTRDDPKLTEQLRLVGHKVFEALDVAQALYFCEHERLDVIVIAGDIEDQDFTEAQLRYIIIRMKPEASAKDLIWELSQLFPGNLTTVQ